MKKTTNLQLKKPDYNDVADIATINANMDILDKEIAKKVDSNHNHTKNQITDFPSSLKNPNSLTILLNGVSQGSYDGSTAQSINITASSVGAIDDNHTHNISQISNLQDTLNNKADTNHSHMKSQITDFPTAIKNPELLKIRLRDIDTYYYDGSTAKTIDITADSVGAAKSKHTHSNATTNSSGFMSETDKSNLDNIVKRKIKLFYDKINDGDNGEIRGVSQAKREKWFRIAEATPISYITTVYKCESIGLFMISNLWDFTTLSSFMFVASSNYKKAGLKQIFTSKIDEDTILRICIPKVRIVRSKSLDLPSYLDVYIKTASRIHITYIGDNWTLYESSNIVPVDDSIPDTHVSAELTFTDLYDVTV